MNCRAAAKSVSSTPVKASAADARTGKFGSGFRARAGQATGPGCRRVALPQVTVQYAVLVFASDGSQREERRSQAPSGSPGRDS
jgi:hypothetical protein